jgi:hypothetical protein
MTSIVQKQTWYSFSSDVLEQLQTSGSDLQEAGHFSLCPLHCYKKREKGVLIGCKGIEKSGAEEKLWTQPQKKKRKLVHINCMHFKVFILR